MLLVRVIGLLNVMLRLVVVGKVLVFCFGVVVCIDGGVFGLVLLLLLKVWLLL